MKSHAKDTAYRLTRAVVLQGIEGVAVLTGLSVVAGLTNHADAAMWLLSMAGAALFVVFVGVVTSLVFFREYMR